MATRTAAQQSAGGRKPGQKNKVSKASISKDIRLQVLTSLNFVGGVQFLVKQARKQNNAPYMALLAKCLQQDDGAGDHGITFVVRPLMAASGPVPGVLASPIAEHIAPPLKLVANGMVVADDGAGDA